MSRAYAVAKGVYFGKLERGMTFKITTKEEAHLVRFLCGFRSCLGVGELVALWELVS